jgi:hypothetical protein
LRAPEDGIAYARHAFDPVEDIDGDVVGEKQRIVAVLWRVEGNGAEQRGRLLLHRDALALNLLRQAREGGLNPVVDVDGVDIGISAELERCRQRVAAVIAAHALHVHHLVDADELRLDRLRNRPIHDHRTGARINSGYGYLRRNDVGILGERDRQERERARNGDHNGDDDR